MNPKIIGLGALAGALLIYIGTLKTDISELGQALEMKQTKLSLTESQLVVANMNAAMADAVIDKQNTLIAALEDKLATARTLAEAQLADISRLSNEKRAAIKDMPAEETLEVIKQHLTEFSNG